MELKFKSFLHSNNEHDSATFGTKKLSPPLPSEGPRGGKEHVTLDFSR